MAPTSTVTSSRISQDDSQLPIRQRGLFLHDDYFQSSREHFHQALDKILHDWEDEKISDWHSDSMTNWDENIFSDRLKRYRSLKKDQNKTGSQAVTEISNEHQHMIILDVREFMHGSLRISHVGPHELLVSGSIDSTTSDDASDKRTFEKSFQLPPEAIITETISALSSDGILTIISPNKFKDEFLTISRRGQYFTDSIFKDPHQDFNGAVKNVLQRWNETSEDEMASYRNLRRRSLEEDNQAFTEKENYLLYKIVIDVHDFLTDGEVNVKVVNDKYLEVKGCINKEEDENIYKMNFNRRFTLPRNTDIPNISALISSDGVLTITSPKMVEQSDFKETIIPVKLQNILKNKSSDSTSGTNINKSSQSNSSEMHIVAVEECMSEIKSDIESEKPEELKENVTPVTLKEADVSLKSCDKNTSEKEDITVPESVQDKLDMKDTAGEISDSNISTTIPSPRIVKDMSELPIRQRGLFLHDDYFQDSREQFRQALDKVLHDWGDQEFLDWHSSSLTDWDENIFIDQLKRYRSLRKDQNTSDSQAVAEISNEHQHKIIIDVREFMQGCLKLLIVGPHELLVEGSIDETTVGFYGKRTFEKRFLLPSEAIISETTSALSSDGILTIITPHDFKDEFIPISRRGQYYNDTIFKDPHQDFNSAIRNVLKRWNETSDDELASYRNLRHRSLEEDNQAFTEKENFQVYKIVIDVQDFLTDGEVNVKVVNDKYLEVKGCIDKEEDETICQKNFKRRFTLPRNTDIEKISALLSSDGVLTITSPKKIGQSVFKETIIPVKLQNILRNESSDSSSENVTNH